MPRLTDPLDVIPALAELTLNEELLMEVIRRGEALRNSATANHPRTAPGLFFWLETVRALRDVLPGSRAKVRESFETCVCPGERDEIAVLSGDRATGTEMDPQPKYPKRRTMAQEAIVRCQMPLFSQDDVVRPAGPRLWFLLVRREKDVAIAELSRPEAIDDAGRVVKWATRIVLRPVAVSASPDTESRTEYTEPVDIDIVPAE